MAKRSLRSRTTGRKKPNYVVENSDSNLEEEEERGISRTPSERSSLNLAESDSSELAPPRRRNPVRSKRNLPRSLSPSSAEEEEEDYVPPPKTRTKVNPPPRTTIESSEEEPFCVVCKIEDNLNTCHRCEVVLCSSCDKVLKTVSEFTPTDEEPMLKKWCCYNCKVFGGQVDVILTYKTEKNRKLFLIKWEEQSYHDVSWTLMSWLKTVSPAKLRNFELRMKELPTPPTKSEVIDPEWLIPEMVIDITRIGPKIPKTIRYVDEVLIKWGALPFDKCTWENYSQLSPEIQEKLQPLTEKFLSSLRIKHTNPVNKKKENFLELKEQPSFIKGGQLYPYQLEGLNWLYYLWTQGTPSILADEMGLGKTIQVVCFLNLVFLKANVSPFLVIVPKAVIPNWYRELAHWAPNLNVAIYTGSSEERSILRDTSTFKDGFLRAHVLLTTYDTTVRELGYINRFGPWQVVVLDEGQRLKSGSSKTFLKLKQIESKHRVLMTGTPLQNNINELFTLMSYMDPQAFNDAEEFEETYSDLNEQTVSALHKLLQPYFLRRTKAMVLKDLPKKVEVTLPVSMTSLQKEISKATLSRNFKLLASIAPGRAINNQPTQRSSLSNIFMELRKCLNHPYLHIGVEPMDDNASKELIQQRLIDASGKLKLLHRILKLLKSQGHRVLLFSQFKIVLDIIEDYLNGEGYKSLRIDGDLTGEIRQSYIDQFNEPNSDVFIFMLTTRAGGVGMNLATADTVIIYDMDFNPHSDLQALARAHRIGQKKEVLVLRLVTIDSIEERIMQIAKQKLVLDHLIIEKMSSVDLTPIDIEGIIRFGAKALFDESESRKEQHYTDQELVELLDRDVLVKSLEEDSEANSFGLARVWTNNDTNSPSNDVDDKSFWNSLLEKRLAEMNTEEEKLGRGARRRTNRVTHNQVNWSDDNDNSNQSDYKQESSDTDDDEMDDNDISDTDLKSLATTSNLKGKPPAKKARSNSIKKEAEFTTPNLSLLGMVNSVKPEVLGPAPINKKIRSPPARPAPPAHPGYAQFRDDRLAANAQSLLHHNQLSQVSSGSSAYVATHQFSNGYPVRPMTNSTPLPTSFPISHPHPPSNYSFRPVTNHTSIPPSLTSPIQPILSPVSSTPPTRAVYYFCTWCQVNHVTQCPMYIYNYSVHQLKRGILQNPHLAKEPHFNYFTQWCMAQQNLPPYVGPPPTQEQIKALFPSPRPPLSVPTSHYRPPPPPTLLPKTHPEIQPRQPPPQ